nr:hypothetical protein [Tanacetum cinerariifolium]GEZ67022.1 hypothetical protein [Tanacetum cinerariifolium]
MITSQLLYLRGSSKEVVVNKGTENVQKVIDNVLEEAVTTAGIEEAITTAGIKEAVTTTGIEEATKAKQKMLDPEKPLKKKAHIQEDQELAQRLFDEEKAQLEKEQRLAMEKAEEQKALIEECDDVQATIDADKQLAEQLQAQEREQLSVEEKSKLFTKLIESRRKYFAAKRAKKIRNKPPTKAHQKSLMCTYLKNMDGYKQKAGDELEQESANRQRLEKEDDSAELQNSIVKARFEKTKPVDDMDNLLLHTLKTMFEHHVEDTVWTYQQGLSKVKSWKLYNSCEVYCITMQNIVYYLLVEKMYPLTKNTLHQLWNDVRLQVDYECEMAYDLLGLIRNQIIEGYTPH